MERFRSVLCLTSTSTVRQRLVGQVPIGTIIGRIAFVVSVGFSVCCVPAAPAPARAPEQPPFAEPFLSVPTQSPWTVESVRDEFDGSITRTVNQLGQDMELLISIFCAERAYGVSLIPGPTTDWGTFAHGRVDLRFDDGEPQSRAFTNENDSLWLRAPVLEPGTVLTDALAGAFGDLMIRQGTVLIVIDSMVHAETLALRVRTFPTGSAVDTFDLRSLPLVLAQMNCPAMPSGADSPLPPSLIRARPGILSPGR